MNLNMRFYPKKADFILYFNHKLRTNITSTEQIISSNSFIEWLLTRRNAQKILDPLEEKSIKIKYQHELKWLESV